MRTETDRQQGSPWQKSLTDRTLISNFLNLSTIFRASCGETDRKPDARRYSPAPEASNGCDSGVAAGVVDGKRTPPSKTCPSFRWFSSFRTIGERPVARRPLEKQHVPMRVTILGNFFVTGTRFRGNWIFIRSTLSEDCSARVSRQKTEYWAPGHW